jgi:hypothetical protein
MRTDKVNFISDKKILSWNDRLQNSKYTLRPEFTSRSPFPEITVWVKSELYPSEQTLDPHINYKFSFSVSSNRTEQFFDILNKLLKLPFETYFTYKEKDYNIELNGNSNIVSGKKEETHKLLEKEYTRFTYDFSGKLTHVIAYISCIEDTISYFEKIWGYDEEGREHCLLKYPIGSIVSTTKDKSKDYLVLDYSYEKDTNDNYFVNYQCCEMLNTNSPIIQYGDSNLYYEDELCFSRNNRIDDILN